MNPLRVLISNYVIDVGFLAWFAAQLLKTILAYIPSRKIIWERMWARRDAQLPFGAGVRGVGGRGQKARLRLPGVRALAGDGGHRHVRRDGGARAAGEQAKVLNKMVIDFKEIFQMLKEEFDALARGEDAPRSAAARTSASRNFWGIRRWRCSVARRWGS